MNEKYLAAGFCVICLLICLSLLVGMLIFGPAQAGANEILAAMPAVKTEEGGWNTSWLSELTEYINDHFFARNELISIGNRIKAAVFASSGEQSVILGSSGWLYYASTLDDYTGTLPMTKRELFCAAKNLSLMQEYCEERQIALRFVIAPDKNALYDENMPDFGTKAQKRDAQRLLELLDEMGVCSVDLYTAFREQEQVLYFAHDSHWNSRGAALAADEILHSLGKSSSYFSADFSQTEAHTGDLYEMLYPAFADSERNPVCSQTLSFTHEGQNARPDSITLNTRSAGGEDVLLAYRDSFGNLLYPYLADAFAQARFSRSTAYDLTQAEALGADCVIIELVERNLSYLQNAPVMPSPLRAVQAEAHMSASLSLTQQDRAPEGCICLSGTAPEEIDDDSPVYVVTDTGTYEAFLCANGGFCVYLPQNSRPTQIIATVGGIFTACNTK